MVLPRELIADRRGGAVGAPVGAGRVGTNRKGSASLGGGKRSVGAGGAEGANGSGATGGTTVRGATTVGRCACAGAGAGAGACGCAGTFAALVARFA